MPRILITYYSRTGNTAKIAEAIAEGAKSVKGVEVIVKRIEETSIEDLLRADTIVIGSPTYYGLLAEPVKKLIDESVKIHGKLDGKIGAAFTSAGGASSGAETTIMSILTAMLVHGMIVQGDPKEQHYGAVSIGKPERREIELCKRKGKRIAELTLKIFGK